MEKNRESYRVITKTQFTDLYISGRDECMVPGEYILYNHKNDGSWEHGIGDVHHKIKKALSKIEKVIKTYDLDLIIRILDNMEKPNMLRCDPTIDSVYRLQNIREELKKVLELLDTSNAFLHIMGVEKFEWSDHYLLTYDDGACKKYIPIRLKQYHPDSVDMGVIKPYEVVKSSYDLTPNSIKLLTKMVGDGALDKEYAEHISSIDSDYFMDIIGGWVEHDEISYNALIKHMKSEKMSDKEYVDYDRFIEVFHDLFGAGDPPEFIFGTKELNDKYGKKV